MEPSEIVENPFDSAPLASKDEYAIYYNMLLFYLDLMLSSQKELQLTEQEIEHITLYMQYIIQTVRALRVRYLYDSEHSVKLDVHESGFPSYFELRNMYNELKVKNQIQKPLMSIEEIKKKTLDYLCTQKQALPDEMLKELSIQYYLQTTEAENIFYRFMHTKIVKARSSEVASDSYMISWAAFEPNKNRPLIYTMYFRYSGKNLEEDTQALYKSIEENGTYLRDLSLIGSMIDRELFFIHPTLIKCIDIGPLHSVFSHDENPISLAIRNGVDEHLLEPLTGCLEIHVSVLRAVGETKVGASTLWGKDHQVFQTYLASSGNKRGASQTNDYFIGSHSLLQYITRANLEKRNYIIKEDILIDNINKQL